MNIPINIYKDRNGIFIAESSYFPGFHTYGKNMKELEKNIRELLELYKELVENGEVEYSGLQFVSLQFSEINTINKNKKHVINSH